VATRVEGLLRELAPHVLSGLVRRYGQFDACEDAVQEALVAAATSWTEDAVPENPKAWLRSVASRRLIDEIRSDAARRRREEIAAALAGNAPEALPPATETDDTLTLLFLCCHPAVTPASQVALTLRAVGGLTTEEIATAFLLPPATMGPRISRAKAQIKSAGATFAAPSETERVTRLPVVLQVLYLIFNEGYTSSAGPTLHRPDLVDEAIRLTRLLRRALPADGEVAGLLALMLFTDARRDTRTTRTGDLVLLADQDRTRWDRRKIAEADALISSALSSAPPGPYQLQAAIAAVHCAAATVADTDWAQIAALYAVLETLDPSPVVTMNRAVAVAMSDSPDAGLRLLDTVRSDERLQRGHRYRATRAHLLELAGDRPAARAEFTAAAKAARSAPERTYLERQVARLG
jgi:RNA polymerase sigma factor (sigma-70 family)